MFAYCIFPKAFKKQRDLGPGIETAQAILFQKALPILFILFLFTGLPKDIILRLRAPTAPVRALPSLAVNWPGFLFLPCLSFLIPPLNLLWLHSILRAQTSKINSLALMTAQHLADAET